MTFAGSDHSSLRVAGGVLAFAVISLLLQVNSGLDRVIQRAVGRISWSASEAFGYFIDLTR
jgi:hypothetical protein